MDKFEKIKAKLLNLKTLDNQYKVFGAKDHKYELNPCLTEFEIKSIENFTEIPFPEDYREFLLKIGDGGAGPHYGIYRINKAINFNYKDYYSFPFPFEKFWDELNDPEELVQQLVHNEYYRDEFNDEDYEDDNYIRGAIPICAEGCGHMTMLVISGKERGNMWGDSRCSSGGIYPLSSINKTRLSFIEWYEKWLDLNIQDYEFIKKLMLNNFSIEEIEKLYKENSVTIANTAKNIIISIINQKEPENLSNKIEWLDKILTTWKINNRANFNS